MIVYAFRRLLALLPTIVVPMVLLFVLLRLAPGGPAAALLGDDATPEQIAVLQQRLGLDEPLWRQFGDFFAGLVRLDFGDSLFLHSSVTGLVLDRLVVTATFVTLSMMLALVTGVAGARVASRFHNRLPDRLLVGLAVVGNAIPSFWLAVMLVGIFAVQLGWLPVAGYAPPSNPAAWARHLVLPVVCLGVLQGAQLFRYARTAMLDSMHQPFVATARSLGLPEKTIHSRYVTRMTLVPVVTVFGLSLGTLLGGAVILETVFSLPGLGQLLLTAVQRRDYPLIQGCAFFIAVIMVLANLAVDLFYAYADPRIRYGKAE
ncbi:ABC transporter permease [Cellulomonas sp. P24]|uniref:ABC transporter permease n=1 Tax=Cellulomonas sp. P24 TaxID=2885206 RepID=UPI00216B57E3|nr:ABC transporter permease [Cellulomonas sp. P24]MCR6492214.1 ABC transporter permease [Cellulomonas sp. P24]